ncbi:MAG: acetyl-CoA carboxylase, carboxyltransferase subunit beta [Bacillota bacterium]|nr:acetyl-CoA carboxylase, carboxyltransferase subunit beta [Bacillota bacterium]
MNPFQQRKNSLLQLKSIKGKQEAVIHNILINKQEKPCPNCGENFTIEAWENNFQVCPYCGHHEKLAVNKRLAMVMDKDSFIEMDAGIVGGNPLSFPGYAQKVRALRKDLPINEAVVCGRGEIKGIPLVTAVMDSSFLMGSMGTAVGEKITRAVEYATEHSLPIVIFAASGGARMQEGILSLMQMAKTAGALQRHSQAGQFYLSILTNPTTGGVTASFAFLGDIILAEPKALIAFAGPRVIKETIKEELPEGFQTSEYLLHHGFLDGIVTRQNMRDNIAALLSLHQRREHNG